MSLYVDIKKKYKDFTLDVKFDNEGQRLGILGASGCGKTMTLKCIAGIEKPDYGKIILNDRVLFDSKKNINLPPQKRNVGYLFQNYALFPNMTVKKNIEVGIHKNPNKLLKVEQMIDMLHLQGLENRYPAQLSGGQQQRVAIARILVYEPSVLMLDEPFSALDSYLKDKMQQELFGIIDKYKGDTLIVSHDRDEIYRFCNKMAIIDHGRLVMTGNTKDVFNNPIYLETARLTGCKNISKANKISDYEVEAIDWGVRLKTDKMVEEEVKFVGIRAHDIRISESELTDNTLEVDFVGYTEEPFENTLSFRNVKKGHKENVIRWKISKDEWNNSIQENIPRYITLTAEHIILLKCY